MSQPRIVTWRAVSTEDQAEKESLDHQDRLNKEHVARWNGIIIEELEVPGVSRSIVLWEDACRQIPAYARLDELIRARAFDVLMCMDVTRLGRDRALITTTAALCERAGIRIYETSSPPTSLDGPHSTADTRLLMTLKGHISEEEVRKFKERTHFGRLAHVRKGKHLSNRPWGLKRVYDEASGKSITVVDEEWRPLILLFYELYIWHGCSLNAIYREFNTRGIVHPVTGKAWNHHTIRVFLRNRWAYAGYVTWGTYSLPADKQFRVKAEWEPIITEEAVRYVEREMKRRRSKPRATHGPHRFSLVALCHHCGDTIAVHSVVRYQGQMITQYRCRKRCRGGFIKDIAMREALAAAIAALAKEVDLDALAGETPDHFATLQDLLSEAQRGLEKVRRERDNLTRAFMRDTIELEEYERLMAELKERHDKLARTVSETEDQIAATPTAAQRKQSLEEVRAQGLAMLDHPDAAAANAFLRAHFTLYIKDGEVSFVKVF